MNGVVVSKPIGYNRAVQIHPPTPLGPEPSTGSRQSLAPLIRALGPLLAILSHGIEVPACQDAEQPPNVLIVIADDLGVDRVAAYGHRNAAGNLIAPKTPNIDGLAKTGVLFRNAWAAPLCSPARAMALTGMYPHRTGLGRFIPNDDPSIPGLNPDIPSLPDALPDSYRSAAIGKWHLATPNKNGRANKIAGHALHCGFDTFRGTPGNLQTRGQSYEQFDWATVRANDIDAVDVQRKKNSYVTSFTTDEALETIREFQDKPWLVWVGYHAPHRPLHAPPEKLIHTEGLNLRSKLGKGKAMIEALDVEIGRLLAGIAPETMERTIIIFFGDNGTQRDLIEPPFHDERGKGTVYSNGVQVPFIVSGGMLPAGSRGEESRALIDLTDILPTVAELVGVETPRGLDGQSFVRALSKPGDSQGRSWIYSERFADNFDALDGTRFTDRKLGLHSRTIRGERYKLITHHDPAGAGATFELYDLQADFHESRNLLDSEQQPPSAAQRSYDELLAQLRVLAER